MIDPDQLLVANLAEALRQVQQYVGIALGASVSALALTTRFASKRPVTLPTTSVAVQPELAQLVLLGLVFVFGLMAAYAADTASAIAGRLDPKLLLAACSFPSVASSPYILVRALAAILPLGFALAAVFRATRSAQAVAGWAVFLGAGYGWLLLQLVRSSCVS